MHKEKVIQRLAVLVIAALVFPSISAAEYAEMNDGAKIYYQEQGKGQTIILVHGWTCSSKFWQKNVPELAKEFRVVALDLRGHGNSSKTLTGHTIAQYARDVRAIVERLDLRGFILVGWSLGGPVVLSYYEQFNTDGRLKALGLIDSDPFPFSQADWNNHPLKNYNFDAMNTTFGMLAADQKKFATAFTGRMFKQKPSDADVDWVVTELTKTPPWIAIAIYSDFVMSDYAKALPDVKIPLIVFAADSGVYPKGIAMGKALASQAPHGKFVPVEDGGHMLFYEQPQEFNTALAGFVKELK
jgi:pimeloyl-ACP methyl ester carboxylesterase